MQRELPKMLLIEEGGKQRGDGANYEFEDGTSLPRMGPRPQGWDPAPQGMTLTQNHCISIQNTKKNLNRAMPFNRK